MQLSFLLYSDRKALAFLSAKGVLCHCMDEWHLTLNGRSQDASAQLGRAGVKQTRLRPPGGVFTSMEGGSRGDNEGQAQSSEGWNTCIIAAVLKRFRQGPTF